MLVYFSQTLPLALAFSSHTENIKILRNLSGLNQAQMKSGKCQVFCPKPSTNT